MGKKSYSSSKVIKRSSNGEKVVTKSSSSSSNQTGKQVPGKEMEKDDSVPMRIFKAEMSKDSKRAERPGMIGFDSGDSQERGILKKLSTENNTFDDCTQFAMEKAGRTTAI